ncbi:MAG: hypothetical protein JXA16_01030 [Bacteroidales bacterium]|nr:hypothetical protein [Bacteroidales bacterium]
MAKVTKEQIAEWKRKHGDVFKYTTEDGKICYLKRPDRKILAYAKSVAGSDPMKFNELLLENCFIEGDDAIKIKDKYFIGISSKLEELIEVTVGELEKL